VVRGVGGCRLQRRAATRGHGGERYEAAFARAQALGDGAVRSADGSVEAASSRSGARKHGDSRDHSWLYSVSAAGRGVVAASPRVDRRSGAPASTVCRVGQVVGCAGDQQSGMVAASQSQREHRMRRVFCTVSAMAAAALGLALSDGGFGGTNGDQPHASAAAYSVAYGKRVIRRYINRSYPTVAVGPHVGTCTKLAGNTVPCEVEFKAGRYWRCGRSLRPQRRRARPHHRMAAARLLAGVRIRSRGRRVPAPRSCPDACPRGATRAPVAGAQCHCARAPSRPRRSGRLRSSGSAGVSDSPHGQRGNPPVLTAHVRQVAAPRGCGSSLMGLTPAEARGPARSRRAA
jgi:hypothetical protein